MRKLTKILIILIIIIVTISGIVYIDYFYAKTNNTYPRISVKEEKNINLIYKAPLYKVIYCKSNKKYIFASYNEIAICPKDYKYDNGYYTNSEGIKISQKDVELMLSNGIYTSEMIDTFTTTKQIKIATFIANEYGLKEYKIIDENDNYKLVVFPTFDKKEDKYEWIYNESKENYYCLKGSNYKYQIAKYEDDDCGTFEKYKMSDEWCNNYKKSTLIYKKNIDNYCK